ncbi:hypothetical protein DFH07DRAFT_962844 [Mycena maculata]|uniref:F-box domain-containing protein n=1 Tax=Mycena maculata TaxID=230809 RepID=A0AAD7N5S0_9AGAR|nr:hypothetical protein DFH07DRAFT_962844 [Mycena maculata]
MSSVKALRRDEPSDTDVLDLQAMSLEPKSPTRRGDVPLDISPRHEALASILSPIELLPDELLGEIMVLAVKRPTLNLITVLVKREASAVDVMSLCEVCYRWRQIALRTPQLWIRHFLPLTTRDSRQLSLTGTAMFFERSAPFPIHARLHSLGKALAPALNVLSRVAHRWKSLAIESVAAEFEAAALAQIPAGRLDGLAELRLTLLNPEIFQCPNSGVFQSAPRLRDLTISMWDAPHTVPMPWAQLTQLSLKCGSPQACLDILVQCHNIVSAKVHTKQWAEVDVSIGATVSLKHLELLEIDMQICSSGDHLSPFLQRLHLPSLKSLSLALALALPVDYEWFVSWLTPALTLFLTRSKELENLELSHCIFAYDIPEVLWFTPSLTRLQFVDDDSVVDDDFFDALRYSESDSTHLAPKLETLDLMHMNVGVELGEFSLGQMIRSRWWSDDELLAMAAPPGVVRLKCVKMGRWIDDDLPPFTQGFNETLRVYRSQGLDIRGF